MARKRRVVALGAVAALAPLLGCADSSPLGACDAAVESAVWSGQDCNGSPALCARRYDEVAYLVAHNAMSNQDDGWDNPNQHHGIRRALEDGVRGLMLDLHYYRGEVYLCHALCTLGRRPFADALCDLRDFLATHPGEVVTLILESYVSPADVAALVQQAGLADRVHTQALGAPWPTLGAMLGAGRQLVIFLETGGGDPAWLHDFYRFAGETRYSYAAVSDFDCTPNRGAISNDLFLLNHFLTQTFGREDLAAQANQRDVLQTRIERCHAALGRWPNYVALDFYDLGAGAQLVAQLNAR